MDLMNLLIDPTNLHLQASIALGDNGSGAKSAPVKITANSGQPIDYPGFGRIVWDFDSMDHAARIPLDYAHCEQDSNGYLNKFDVTASGLVVSGAIVIADDETATLVAKMREGVPYQASIESHGGDLEVIQENETAQVNGNIIVGPCFIVRNWTLAAVAICKFGADANTSSELVLAASKNLEKKHNKVLYVRKMTMDENKPAAEVEAAPVVEATVVVETEAVKEVTDIVTDVVAEEEAAEQAAVDPKASAETSEEVVEAAPVAIAASMVAVANDPKAEIKKFIATFGVKANDYFLADHTFESAMQAHLKFQNTRIVELEKIIASIDRGAAKPVKLVASEVREQAGPKGLDAVFTFNKETK